MGWNSVKSDKISWHSSFKIYFQGSCSFKCWHPPSGGMLLLCRGQLLHLFTVLNFNVLGGKEGNIKWVSQREGDSAKSSQHRKTAWLLTKTQRMRMSNFTLTPPPFPSPFTPPTVTLSIQTIFEIFTFILFKQNYFFKSSSRDIFSVSYLHLLLNNTLQYVYTIHTIHTICKIHFFSSN